MVRPKTVNNQAKIGVMGPVLTAGGGATIAPKMGVRSVQGQVVMSRNGTDAASLQAPIRQTASIFKQPVTLVHTTSKETKQPSPAELKIAAAGRQDKPHQVFWAKRLDGLRSCSPVDGEAEPCAVPSRLIPVGPEVHEGAVEASLAAALSGSTALPVSGLPNVPVSGQPGPKKSLDGNPGVYILPEQPLFQAVVITDSDIQQQERRVMDARRRLIETLKHFG